MTWSIAILALAAVLFRPFRVNEAVWAAVGAVLLVVTGSLGLADAGAALDRGRDVYAFLIGMMALAEFAKFEGVFDWLAARAVTLARGSRAGLFALVYGVGILTTTFLSNDATIVVLTPAVIAAVARIGVKPLPYLYACALIANAASFVLPISNPSNLLVFAGHMPPLATWMRWLLVPSIASIGLTFLAIYVVFRRDLRGSSPATNDALPPPPHPRATIALVLAALVLVVVSSLGGPVGYATFAAALVAVGVAACAKREAPVVIAREMSWGIVPLTAALFVIVAAIDRAGGSDATRRLFAHLSPSGIGWVTALASNLVNNLPVGVNVGLTVAAGHATVQAAYAALVGLNLGPNFTANGSLATILWLSVVRRSGIAVSGFGFLRVGLLVTPLALAAALLLVH